MSDCLNCKYRGGNLFGGRVWGFTECMHPDAETINKYGSSSHKTCEDMRSCLIFGCARGKLWVENDE